MHGMADPANEPGAYAGLGQALGASGVSVRLRAFDHASYAWDRPVLGREGHALLPRPDGPVRVLAEAWPTLTALSATEVAGFFATNLHSCRP